MLDQSQYSTLIDAVAAIPDPRHARGKRHAWRLLLTLVAALVSGQRTNCAIGHWVHEHQTKLATQIPVSPHGLPSASTLRRALLHLDITAREAQIAACGPARDAATPPDPAAPRWQDKRPLAKRCGARTTMGRCIGYHSHPQPDDGFHAHLCPNV